MDTRKEARGEDFWFKGISNHRAVKKKRRKKMTTKDDGRALANKWIGWGLIILATIMIVALLGIFLKDPETEIWVFIIFGLISFVLGIRGIWFLDLAKEEKGQ